MHTQLSDTNLKIAKFNTGRSPIFSLYFILPSLIIAGIYAYSVHFLYGFSLFPDEFGYWSSAAAAIGYDWSEVTSLGYYYSFGYALILIPILKIFGGGVAAYRVAILINAILGLGSLRLLYGLLIGLFPDKRREQMAVCSVIGVLYPVWIYYMHLTMVEAVLAFTYILVCYLAMRYMERPGYARLMPLLIAITYLYYLHMRTVAVFAAGIIILVFHAMYTDSMGDGGATGEEESRRGLLSRRLLTAAVILIYSAFAIYVGELVKSSVMDATYAQSTTRQLAANDYAGQFRRVRAVLDVSNWAQILRSLISKLMYLGMSSFGMVYVAVIWLAAHAVRVFGIKKRSTDRTESLNEDGDRKGRTVAFTSLFILATAGAQYLMIGLVNTGGRLDGLPYGRYIEHISPVLLAIGICALTDMRFRYRYLIGSIAYNAIAVTVTTGWSVSAGTNNMHSFCIAGISYLWNEWDLDITGKYLVAYALSGVTMCIVYLCVRIMKSCDREDTHPNEVGSSRRLLYTVVPAAVIVFMEVILGIHLCQMYIYPSAGADKIDGRIAEYIDADSAGTTKEDISVIYISEGNPPFVDVVQFDLMDTTVRVVRARSRYEEIDSSVISGSGAKYSKLDWVPDDNNRDYYGSGDMYRLTDESLSSILDGYENADKLYIISDKESIYKDTLSDSYRNVMDTVWMKLYVPRDQRL